MVIAGQRCGPLPRCGWSRALLAADGRALRQTLAVVSIAGGAFTSVAVWEALRSGVQRGQGAAAGVFENSSSLGSFLAVSAVAALAWAFLERRSWVRVIAATLSVRVGGRAASVGFADRLLGRGLLAHVRTPGGLCSGISSQAERARAGASTSDGSARLAPRSRVEWLPRFSGACARGFGGYPARCAVALGTGADRAVTPDRLRPRPVLGGSAVPHRRRRLPQRGVRQRSPLRATRCRAGGRCPGRLAPDGGGRCDPVGHGVCCRSSQPILGRGARRLDAGRAARGGARELDRAFDHGGEFRDHGVLSRRVLRQDGS